jgi:hypothetical protein
MKNNSIGIIVKRVLSSLLVSTGIFLNAASAQAPVAAVFHENSAVIKFIGPDDDNYVFEVAYNNENGVKFLLSILDSTGNILFAGTYNDRKFDKRFRLEKVGTRKLKFVLRNLGDSSIQTFEVTTTAQVVQDIVVKKVI